MPSQAAGEKGSSSITRRLYAPSATPHLAAVTAATHMTTCQKHQRCACIQQMRSEAAEGSETAIFASQTDDMRRRQRVPLTDRLMKHTSARERR